MTAGTSNQGAEPSPARAGFDRLNAAMALVASLALAAMLWLRLGPPPAPEPPSVGSAPPLLLVRDLATLEPLLLPWKGPASRGRVIWVAFWSARAAGSRAELGRLQKVGARLAKRSSRFVMAAVAVEDDNPAAVRAVVSEAGVRFPVYLAPAATRRSFGLERTSLPIHFVVDANGQIGAVAQGGDDASLDGLADRIVPWLDDLEPLGRTRFAFALLSGSVPRSPGSRRSPGRWSSSRSSAP